MASLREVDFDPFSSATKGADGSSLDKALRVEGITGQLADIAKSIYQQESGSGKNSVVSNAGARGGMQIKPDTFKRFADKGWSIDNNEQNARAAVRYIKSLSDKTGGDPNLIAAGYYGGEGAIPKAKAGIAVRDPRNPKAPNTLQYASQVAGRVPSDAKLREVDFDPFSSKPSDQNVSQVDPQARTIGQDILRQVGLTARAGSPYAAGAALGAAAGAPMAGIGAIPGAAAGAGAVALSELASSIYNPIARATNLPQMIGPGEAVNRFADWIGLPKPETPTEQAVQNIAGAMTGAGAGAKAAEIGAKQLAKTPAVKNVLSQLAARQGMQVGSAAAGSTASEIAKAGGAGVVGQTLANVAGSLVPFSLPMARNLIRGETTALAKEAHNDGYVVPPTQASPTKTSDILESWSGKKTEQKATLKNQGNTNDLIRKEFGMGKDTLLDDQAFESIRNEAGKSYKAVKSVKDPIKTDTAFRNEIQSLGGATSHAAKEFPELMNNPEIAKLRDVLFKQKPFSTTGAIELVKQLRADATNNLKTLGAPDKHALGLAQREAANSIDDLVERNLIRLNKPDLVNQYRKARQTIAKAHDVESVTNTTTGNVSAPGMGRLMNKGKPLSGNLKKVARFSQEFPRSSRPADTLGSVTGSSALDFASAGVAAAHGKLGIAAGLLGRPIARNVLLSKPYQKAIMSKKEMIPLSSIGQSFSQQGNNQQQSNESEY